MEHFAEIHRGNFEIPFSHRGRYFFHFFHRGRPSGRLSVKISPRILDRGFVEIHRGPVKNLTVEHVVLPTFTAEIQDRNFSPGITIFSLRTIFFPFFPLRTPIRTHRGGIHCGTGTGCFGSGTMWEGGVCMGSCLLFTYVYIHSVIKFIGLLAILGTKVPPVGFWSS